MKRSRQRRMTRLHTVPMVVASSLLSVPHSLADIPVNGVGACGIGQSNLVWLSFVFIVFQG